MAKALALGSTGLVGGAILANLRSASASQFSGIDIIARRSPPAAPGASIQTNEIIEKDTTKWATHISSLSPAPSVLFCSLATTRAQAGNFENQYKLEHDLNVELAKAAKASGTKTYVLISSSGADVSSMFGYMKMKGEIEKHVEEIGFDHVIILRPGLLVGQRTEARFSESVLRNIAQGMGKIHASLKDVWAQDSDVIAKAAISAALKAEAGEVKDKVWILAQKDIVRMGRTEWKAPS